MCVCVCALMGITDNLSSPPSIPFISVLCFHVSSMCEKVWVREGGVITLFPLRRVCPVPSGTSDAWAQEQEGVCVCVCVCVCGLKGGGVLNIMMLCVLYFPCAPTTLLHTPNFDTSTFCTDFFYLIL